MERAPTAYPPAEAGRISRATLTAQLEEALRVDILEGVLRPGQRIRASEMTERYGVSATPLREALQRLAVENLVELDPRLGATVARISEDDLRDVYDMLQLIDGLALQRSIERGDDAWLAEVERSFEDLADAIVLQEGISDATPDDERRRIGLHWSGVHWEFHSALYQAGGSPWLLRFVRSLHQHSERYRMLSMQGRVGMQRDSRREHEKILLATRARDADAAGAALHDHLGLTVKLIVDALVTQRLQGEDNGLG